MIFLTVELYTEDGVPIEEINSIVKNVMKKMNIERLDQFQYYTAEILESKRVPSRTIKLIREEMLKKGYYLNGEDYLTGK